MKWKVPCIILGKLNPNKFVIKLASNGKLYTVHVDNILNRSDILLESDKTEKIINDDSLSKNKQISLKHEEDRITRSKREIYDTKGCRKQKWHFFSCTIE